MPTFLVQDLLDESTSLKLRLVNSGANLQKSIVRSDLNRPGLALMGFFDFFAPERVQVFGQGEWAYLNTVSNQRLNETVDRFFEYPLCCLVFTHNNPVPNKIIQKATQYKVPLFISEFPTHKFIVRISNLLDEKLASQATVHGVLIEVFGVGILLQGKSGVGKSETALELIERGHRLVADDIVEITSREGSRLYGSVSNTIEHHMEIRGLGIISIKDLFGAGSVRKVKRIDLMINLEDWDENQEYDRLGLDENKTEILGVEIDCITIPVRPGRNLPILIETAAKNHNLKKMGHHAAKEFNEKLIKIINGKTGETN